MCTPRELRRWFKEFNSKVFDDTLPTVPLRAEYVGPGIWGLCWGNSIAIRDTLEGDEARATLLHEMVHLWQAVEGLEMDHGGSFEKWRQPCLESTGLSL